MSGRVTAVALVLAVAGCGSDNGPTPSLRVQLSVDEVSCGSAPELITFPCQGRVGVWLVDESEGVRDEFCVGMPAGTPLPGLDNVLEDNEVAFDDLELGDIVALQLAVFNDDVPVCERPFGGVGPEPPPDPLPQADTIFLQGQSNFVVLEDTTEIVLPLTCGVVDEQCEAGFTAFTDVVDLETLELRVGPPEIARVQFGFALDGAFVNLSEMAFDPGPGSFSAKLASPPPGVARCVGSVVSTPASPLDILSCDGVAEAEIASILAYVVDQSVIDRLNSTTSIPLADGGFLLGKVVDDSNQPVAGARVVSERGATITYPNLDVDGTVNASSTGKDGFFLMTGPDSECCQQLTVFDDAAGGVEGGVSELTGTVDGMMTVTVISSVPGDVVDPVPVPPNEPAPSQASSTF